MSNIWLDRQVSFHGYPQHPRAHPERPWWRSTMAAPLLLETDMRCWERSDGERVDWAGFDDVDAEMARIDRENPLPAPPALCSQVWVWLDDDGRVKRDCTINEVNRLSHSESRHRVMFGERKSVDLPTWPRGKAALIAGPFAPWMDTSEPKLEPQEEPP